MTKALNETKAAITSQPWFSSRCIKAPMAPSKAISAKVRTPPNNISASRFRSRSTPNSRPRPRATPKRSAKSRSNIPRSLTCLQRSFGRCQFFQFCIAHLGIVQIEIIQRVDDRGTDHDARKPLVIRRHDVPRRMFGRRIANHVFISVHIIIPVFTFLRVIGRKFPVFFRLLNPLEKALFLLFVGDVKKKLADQDRSEEHTSELQSPVHLV